MDGGKQSCMSSYEGIEGEAEPCGRDCAAARAFSPDGKGATASSGSRSSGGKALAAERALQGGRRQFDFDWYSGYESRSSVRLTCVAFMAVDMVGAKPRGWGTAGRCVKLAYLGEFRSDIAKSGCPTETLVGRLPGCTRASFCVLTSQAEFPQQSFAVVKKHSGGRNSVIGTESSALGLTPLQHLSLTAHPFLPVPRKWTIFECCMCTIRCTPDADVQQCGLRMLPPEHAIRPTHWGYMESDNAARCGLPVLYRVFCRL